MKRGRGHAQTHRRVTTRGMKAKSLHTRASVKTGGATAPKGLPAQFGPFLTGNPMPHSGGAHFEGPAAPSTRSAAARVRKHSGGARTEKGKLHGRGSPTGKRANSGSSRKGRSSVPKVDKAVSREDFIRRGEAALGEDTEF